ncbi:MAG: hypothetical protein LWW88_02860 [Acinetobacter sp.]|uniref:antitoxin VbhA family protein n=1 Tax=Acinetobacter sp. TaxID=472 RepID=UPI0025885782|nr:hypothetical protein [Acinetobacter sp.]MCE1270497.1 hypothetical protein [Acinetobacter sp.]
MNSIEKQNELRGYYKQAVAINMLEGWIPTSADFERMERHIRGEVTSDELVNEIIAEGLRKQKELMQNNTSKTAKTNP